MSPTWPTMTAAITLPIPKMSTRVVPEAATARLIRLRKCLALRAEPVELVKEVDRQQMAFNRNRAGRLVLLEVRSRPDRQPFLG
jgi:hypothetical protein